MDALHGEFKVDAEDQVAAMEAVNSAVAGASEQGGHVQQS